MILDLEGLQLGIERTLAGEYGLAQRHFVHIYSWRLNTSDTVQHV